MRRDQQPSIHQALKRMRELTEAGIPFSIGFISYNATIGYTDGYKNVPRASLRLGLRTDQSSKANTLIAYTNLDTGEPRFFYLPLLMKLNGIPVQP